MAAERECRKTGHGREFELEVTLEKLEMNKSIE
jgi:hypothetical protein